jgi:hypothetical protein
VVSGVFAPAAGSDRSGFDRHGRACPDAWVARGRLGIATNGGAVRSSRKTAFGAGEILLDRRTAVGGDPPLREEVVRPQRTAKEKARSYALLATPNL